MWQLDAWENELFDRYNGEGHMTQEEFEANAYDELEETEDLMAWGTNVFRRMQDGYANKIIETLK